MVSQGTVILAVLSPSLFGELHGVDPGPGVIPGGPLQVLGHAVHCYDLEEGVEMEIIVDLIRDFFHPLSAQVAQGGGHRRLYSILQPTGRAVTYPTAPAKATIPRPGLTGVVQSLVGSSRLNGVGGGIMVRLRRRVVARPRVG